MVMYDIQTKETTIQLLKLKTAEGMRPIEIYFSVYFSPGPPMNGILSGFFAVY
jgi:hypothetical protein